MEYIAFDSHKHYTWACVESAGGKKRQEAKIAHERGALTAFLDACESGSPVAVETIGNWYWIVDEIEASGMQPRLVHSRKAKLMMGAVNKTDKLDARGINRLQRSGTLPEVWIAPAQVRDARELPRTRMVLSAQRTRLKNRIHATLAKYALTPRGVSDIYGVRVRSQLLEQIEQLPPHTCYTTRQLLAQLDIVGEQLQDFERRMQQAFEQTQEIQWLKSIPGVGMILATVIATEIGDIQRFPSAAHLASYAGTVPRVHASGGKRRYGNVRQDVNRYLKWAYMEAANVACQKRYRWKQRHIGQLYERIRQRKGHAKAIGAVARHLAEASYWMLKKGEAYKDPKLEKVSSKEA